MSGRFLSSVQFPHALRERAAGSLFDAGKVDLVAESAEGIIDLVIVQDQAWTGSESQLASLQSKVQTYVSFALDGGLAEQFPEVPDDRGASSCIARLEPRTQTLSQCSTCSLPVFRSTAALCSF